ncbi:hypothetical protein [Aquella oligotrophica]|uniref:MFS transporter n=1 Tax=Aquella oligotrophica TaxID=2067065 RepID=A0A2I7N5G0_9NEIS|nr:hypothetical protein [Aquella oligotrophica]AUR51706.1 hypothetical protein CUN60_05155 [Aquella oligotrophica]
MVKHNLIYRYFAKIKERRRQFALIQMFGGILEYYDLFSLGFLFLYLLQVYSGHKLLVHGLAMITLTSYLFRPTGYKLCIWLTHHFTRKQIVHINSISMIVSLSSIALIDIDEDHIYITLMLILLTRVIHGIAFGMKTQANLAYIRYKYPNKKHFAIMNVILGGQFGLSAAIIMNKLIINHFSIEQMTWAWRIPFLASGIVSIILYYFRLVLYTPNSEIKDRLTYLPINTIAMQNKAKIIPALLIASARGTITFTIFLVFPGTLYWRLGWSSSQIANIMLIPTIINTVITWQLKYSRIKQQLRPGYLISGLICLFPLSQYLKYAMSINNTTLIIVSISIIAVINGFLFIAIPRFLEQLFPEKTKLESMVFIHNYEYFGFNLLRGSFLLLAATVFNLPLSLPVYLDLLIYSMWAFLFMAIVAIYSLQKRTLGHAAD